MMGVIGEVTITDSERTALNVALANNCTCGEAPAECPAHSLLRNERALKGLIFARRYSAMFEAPEYDRKGGS